MTCVVCQHPKCDAINAALASGRSPNLVRAQYRLEPRMLQTHIDHRALERDGLLPTPDRNHWLDKPLRPLARFQEAWRDASDDAVEQARMVSWLNEQLQAEDMGL